jgi:phage repressor protein C with HTH and peptisase S24 domain
MIDASERLNVNLAGMSTLQERIIAAMTEKGIDQAGLARAVNVNPVSVNDWRSGKSKSIRSDRLVPVATALGVNPEWLASGRGPQRPGEPDIAKDRALAKAQDLLQDMFAERAAKTNQMEPGNTNNKLRPIHVWDNESDLGGDFAVLPNASVVFSAGTGRVVYEHNAEAAKKQAFRWSWIHKKGISPEEAITVLCEGDSMAERIPDGTSMLVSMSEQDKRIIDGKIYAVRFEDSLYVKYVFKQPGGGIKLVSHNKNFEDITVTPGMLEAGNFEIIGRVRGWAVDYD